jgi:hypothetical protein
MFTVISFKEVEELFTKKSITKSENVNFIDDENFRKFIEQQLSDKLNLPTNGFVAMLTGVGSTFDSDIMNDSTNELLRKIYIPKDPVALILPDTLPSIRVDREVLMETLGYEFDFSDPLIQQAMNSIFEYGIKKQSALAYAFIDRIYLSTVTSLYYPKSLEQRMNDLRHYAKHMDIIFSKTEIFNKE